MRKVRWNPVCGSEVPLTRDLYNLFGAQKGAVESFGFDSTCPWQENLLEGSIEPFWGGRRFQGTV